MQRFTINVFISVRRSTYFRRVFPSIISSSKLHIQRQVFVRPLLLPAARQARLATGSSSGPDRLWLPSTLLFSMYRRSSPGIKRLGREVDHSPPSSAEVKSEWSYTSLVPPARACVLGVGRDSFTVFKFLTTVQQDATYSVYSISVVLATAYFIHCSCPIPEAVITVVRAPDDGCQHPKHVELPTQI